MAAKQSSKKTGASRASKAKEKPTPPHTGVVKLGDAPKPPLGQTEAQKKKSKGLKNGVE